MTPIVKVCCIASVDEARLAADEGARVLGLVSAMPSGPGVIDDATAAEVAAAAAAFDAPPETFLLTSRTTFASIAEQHRRVRSTALQLVDHVPHDDLCRLRDAFPDTRLVQVIHVLGEASIDEALAVAPLVDAILLDSGNPNLTVKELGGTGRVHDWATSRRIREALDALPRRVPMFLAGGLNAGNAGDAVRRVGPYGLDLCSSVRTGGRLDPTKLSLFMRALAGAP